jgi:hypothetical protein
MGEWSGLVVIPSFTSTNQHPPYLWACLLFNSTVYPLVIIIHLITSGASWFEQLCVVAAAVDASLTVEVDEVDKQLLARGTHEACGVPAHRRACPRRKHSHLPARHTAATLQT